MLKTPQLFKLGGFMSISTSVLPSHVKGSCTRPIYVLDDQFVFAELCVTQWTERFRDIGSRVTRLSSERFEREVLASPEIGVMVVPGSDNSFAVADTLAPLITKVQQAVRLGWHYIGSCAGANVASKRMEADPFESPCFDLLPVIAKLPERAEKGVPPSIPQQFDRKGHKVLLTDEQKGEGVSVFWHSGSGFQQVESPEGIKVLATYQDPSRSPAIVSGKYGKGKVVLAGVHPEIDFVNVGMSKEPSETLNPLLIQMLLEVDVLQDVGTPPC
jgi:glutamine amidotransferase-like uncharacterized protein